MVANSIQHCEQTLMFTDIVGYSRLMGRNEALAVEMLGDYRSILLSHICAQGGQLVEFVGDAIFARFDAAAAAVAAAIAIQQHLLAFNEARDKKLPRLQTRIGLHKGEVMLRDGAVFGDTVNIAARLEPIAVADGICISQAVYDEIRLTLSSPAKRLGTQNLKNIQQKIRAYLIKPSGIGWRDHLHYFLCAVKRRVFAYRYPLSFALVALIAAGIYFIPRWLVPGYAANYVEIADFKNLMNEKGDADYFSAGITEAVRSQLADMRDVYIVDAKEGIHAPIRLEGSIQKLGDNLRIAYRLFRRKDNVQIVGGKLDGTYQDIFILQDRLVGEIARYLAEEFKLQNFRPAPLRLTNDITAYDFYLRGLEFLDREISHENVDEAIKHFSTALLHDSNFASANVGICEAYWKKYEITKAISWLKEAEKICSTALQQDSRSVRAYKAIGVVYADQGKFTESIGYLQKGLELESDNAALLLALAHTYRKIGKEVDAENIYKSALTRSSKNWRVLSWYGHYLTEKGRHEEAIEVFENVLSYIPKSVNILNNIAVNYYYISSFQKAAEYFEKAAEIEPNFSVYVNTGNMFYYSGDFSSSINFYEKALSLQPDDYQCLMYLADAYKFMPGGKKKSDDFARRTHELTSKDISSSSANAKANLYLARSYLHLGKVADAKRAMEVVDQSDAYNTDTYYTHLRIALSENDEVNIRRYATELLNKEYSANLLLSDPDFKALNEIRFKKLFND